MCNRYGTPRPEDISSYFNVAMPTEPYRPAIGPKQPGPYVVAGQAVVGQWALIPDGNPVRLPMGWNGKPISTNNCRSEGMRTRSPTFKGPWARGQRCLIPAADFDEPYWGSPTGKNIWWRFKRADGMPWALAGLWNDWTDPETGEIVHSYTMITMNADSHSVMRHMHKPDPKLAADKQDKRTVISVERDDWDQWLSGSHDDAFALIQMPRPDVIAHAPVDPTITETLPR